MGNTIGTTTKSISEDTIKNLLDNQNSDVSTLLGGIVNTSTSTVTNAVSEGNKNIINSISSSSGALIDTVNKNADVLGSTITNQT